MKKYSLVLLSLFIFGCDKPAPFKDTNSPIPAPPKIEVAVKKDAFTFAQKVGEPLFEMKQLDSKLSKEGIQLILDYEVGGGESYYNRYLKFPTVPPGASGITVGIGVDLQFYSKDNIIRMWYKLKQEEAYYLSLASGLNHRQSKVYLPKVKDILINWHLATEVFNNETIPQYYALALRTFPGLDELCPNAQSAATSIIFNRGSSLSGPNRLEMRELRNAIKEKNYQEMANATRRMKRLWEGKNMEGLLKRRDSEAKLFESCLK